jgi:hypothetical protein
MGEPLAFVFLSYAGPWDTSGNAEAKDPDDEYPGEEHPCARAELSFRSFCKFLRQARMLSNSFSQVDALELFASHMSAGSFLDWESFKDIVNARAVVEYPGKKPKVAQLLLLQHKVLRNKVPRPSPEDHFLGDLTLLDMAAAHRNMLCHIFTHYATECPGADDTPDEEQGDAEEETEGQSPHLLSAKPRIANALRITPNAMVALFRDFELSPDFVDEFKVNATPL